MQETVVGVLRWFDSVVAGSHVQREPCWCNYFACSETYTYTKEQERHSWVHSLSLLVGTTVHFLQKEGNTLT